jgi:hypothetical protein
VVCRSVEMRAYPTNISSLPKLVLPRPIETRVSGLSSGLHDQFQDLFGTNPGFCRKRSFLGSRALLCNSCPSAYHEHRPNGRGVVTRRHSCGMATIRAHGASDHKPPSVHRHSNRHPDRHGGIAADPANRRFTDRWAVRPRAVRQPSNCVFRTVVIVYSRWPMLPPHSLTVTEPVSGHIAWCRAHCIFWGIPS